MNELLALEPREAGTDVLEPVVDFPGSGEARRLIDLNAVTGDSTWGAAGITGDSTWPADAVTGGDSTWPADGAITSDSTWPAVESAPNS